MSDRITRSNGRETRAVILEYAKAELEEFGPVKFNILRVIENSGVGRSSVYHQFGDRDGLITAIEVERFIEEIRLSNELLRLSIDAVKTSDELFLLCQPLRAENLGHIALLLSPQRRIFHLLKQL